MNDTEELAKVLNFEKYMKVVYNRKRCEHQHIEVDPKNREVLCLDCQERVDPIEALVTLCQKGSRAYETFIALQAEVKTLRAWNPFLKAVKKLESIWRGSMLPTCPHCGVGVKAEDLASSGQVSKAFAERLRARDGNTKG